MNSSDKEKQSTEQIFRTLYKNYQKEIRSFLYWSLPAQDVDEVFQEVFMKAWKALEKDSIKVERAYLYKIASNQRVDFYRKFSRQIQADKSRDPYLIENISPEDKDLHILVKEIISSLPEKYRDIFVCYYKLEMSIGDISNSLNVKEGSVKSRLHKARELFRVAYGEHSNEK